MPFTSGDMLSSPWRPSVSSPLASSPVRALHPSSPSPSASSSPLLRDDGPRSQGQRVVQSSPIQKPSFRFSSRPAKPNPLARRREDVQEQRRRGFLQSVRQKAEDKSWQRRDIEGQSLRASWLANIGYLSHDAPTLSDLDIEDAMAYSQGEASAAAQSHMQSQDDDDMLQAIQEEDELDFLVSSFEQQQQQQHSPPLVHEDDDDYDDIFAELISREPAQRLDLATSSTDNASSNQMDMSE